MKKLNRFFGNKAFYAMVLSVAVPIMIQNGISNFVGLLDNIMVGKIGTEPMSGASIINQLIFVYNLCIFGAVSGAGIFTAQYYGQNDDEGIRNTFRFKFWIGTVLTAITIALFCVLKEPLITLYLKGEGTAEEIALTMKYAKEYLAVMLWGLPAFMFSQVYASTLRECGKTVLPMVSGIVSVVINLALNYVLIYGHFGAPRLGVVGAAVATVISRYVELALIVIVTHASASKYSFIKGLYRTLLVPWSLVKKILVKGTPLLVNETLWAAGMTRLTQCYSLLGYNVIAANNISTTISNVFNIVFIAMGDAVAIIVGQTLGTGDMEKAKDNARKLTVFSVLCSVGIGAIMFATAPLFPEFYKTSDSIKELATSLIRVSAIFMPQYAFLHATYFTLRSGGKTFITFLFDSVSIWVVSVTLATILTGYTSLNIITIYVLVQIAEWIKCIVGFILVKKGIWLQNIVAR